MAKASRPSETAQSQTSSREVTTKRPPLLARMLVSSTMTGLGLICAIYLANPGWGIGELLPDNIPLIGNLDEAGATGLLLMVLSYWGIDVTTIGKRLRLWNKPAPKALPEKQTKA